MTAILPLLVALAGVPITAVVGARSPGRVPGAAIAVAALTVAAAVWAVAVGGAVVSWPWIPAWGATLTLELDPLAALFLVLTSAIGLLVIVYSGEYIPHHLQEEGRPLAEQTRFFTWMVLFLSGMLGLVLARDLLLLFLFFDLTAISSYFLIAYDLEKREARHGALMALLVTGITSIGFLVGILLLRSAGGSLDLAELQGASLGAFGEWAAALIVVSAMAKSAQVPLHFWLPRAMAAPTPVSAYLHSAAMVAAGVFVLLRLNPVIGDMRAAAALPALGLTSVVVGSLLALRADGLKEILAYSTIAQYGYVLLLIGLGGDTGLAGAAVYILAHAIAKSALFLASGAVTRVTGEDELPALGGLARRYPWLAAATGIAAAALAGLPLTVGYFKDEALFEAALEHGMPLAVGIALAVALTVGYTARFWFGIFAGRPEGGGNPGHGVSLQGERPGDPEDERAGDQAAAAREAPPVIEERVPLSLLLPIGVLALTALLGGLVPSALASVGAAAGGASAGSPVEFELEYKLGTGTYLALAAYAAGASIYLTRAAWGDWLAAVHRAGARFGPERFYELALAGLNGTSDRLHELEVRDLRDRLAAILVPAGVLILAGLLFADTRWQVGPLAAQQIPLLAGVITVGMAALLATVKRTHISLVIALTVAGYGLAALYALLGATEVALVVVLVETMLTLLLLTALGGLPRRVLYSAEEPEMTARDPRHAAAGIVAGLGAFAVSWAVLSADLTGSVAAAHEELRHLVHAKDTVSAILSDFRGLDTVGEITVLVIAFVGLRALLTRDDP